MVAPGIASAAPGDAVGNPGTFTTSLYNYIPSVGIPGPTGYTPGVSGSFVLSGIGGALDASGPPGCNDGKNNDDGQDTNIDYPADSQCSSATDDNEVQSGFQAKASIGATGTVAATGAVTGVNLSIPEMWVYASGNIANVKVTNNTPPAGSTLNAKTGQALLKADIKAVIKASILTCTIGSVKLNLSNYGTTPGLPALQPLVGKHLYDQFTGKTTLVDNQYTIPSSSGFLCGSQLDPSLGLPAAAGESIAEVSVILNPIFQQGNFAPTANAGPAQTVASAAAVNLAGSGTDGGDGPLPITYAWTQTAGPAVTLSSTTVANPSFTAPAGPTSLTFQLKTNDGLGTSAGSNVTITVNAPANVPPTANAGPPQTVASGAGVSLAGSGTDGGDGPGPLTYAWTQTAGPAVTLSSTTVANPSFTAPVGPTSLTFQLVTNDGAASSPPSSVTITVNAPPVNVPPTANAGPTQNVVTAQSVTLDGTGSNDPDSYPGPLTYAWTQTGGQPVTLSSSTVAQPTFTAPAIACSALTFSLTVNDGAASSAPSSVTINLAPASPAVATAYDFDGDGMADKGVYRNGGWLIIGQPTTWFGLATDKIVPGDYDGNGIVDKSVYRNGAWLSQCPTVYLGNATDTPVPADYNGDGKDDRAIYRNGAWIVQNQATQYFGSAGDIPVVADYDGNGTDDRAVYRAGTWLIDGQATQTFGLAGDIPVPADYTGDGKADIRVYRGEGGWLSPTLPAVYWGRVDTKPVPADYDGNGSDDLMIYFPTYGAWTSPVTSPVYFGNSTDVPLSVAPSLR